MNSVDVMMAVVFVVLILLFYPLYGWLLRRVLDPDGSFRELPLPWFLRWVAMILAILTAGITPWLLILPLRGLLHLLT